MATVLKVSLLADGSLLLDGKTATLDELASAMDAAPKGETAVLYYRESAAGEPPPIVEKVMKLIIDRRLPVRLSTKPDFSDAVGPQLSGVFDKIFAAIRKSAAEGKLVILRADGKVLSIPALAKEVVPAEQIATIERLLPSSVQRKVAVLSDTSWAAAPQPSIQDAGKAIPFFGLLMGLTTIGHAVWIFNPSTPQVLAAGCGEADLVIVDSDKLAKLPSNWQSLALASAGERKPEILIHDRATHQLKKAT